MLHENKIYKTLMLMSLGHFLVDMMIGFWPLYKTMFHLNLAVAGIIAGICPFVGEGMQIFFGALGDKGYRKILALSGIIGAALITILPYTQQYSFILCLYMLTCIGSGAFHPSAVAVISSLTEKRKSFFISVFATGGALGMAFSQLIFTKTLNTFDGSSLILMVPSFLLGTYLFSSSSPGLHGKPAAPNRKYGFSAMKKLFQNKELLILYTSQLCNSTVFWGFIFLLPDVLLAKGYPSWIAMGMGHFFFIIGGALVLIPGGYLADRYSTKTVVFAASILSFIQFYTFLLIPGLPDFAVLSILFGLGASLNIVAPVVIAHGNKLMPSRPGLVSAFLMGMVWCFSEALGPGGGGLLTLCFEEQAPIKALCTLGIFFAGAITSILFLPKEVSKEYEWEVTQ
jgi:FSR family fosmidomycin resistance protein-like MFS transporter